MRPKVRSWQWRWRGRDRLKVYFRSQNRQGLGTQLAIDNNGFPRNIKFQVLKSEPRGREDKQ